MRGRVSVLPSGLAHPGTHAREAQPRRCQLRAAPACTSSTSLHKTCPASCCPAAAGSQGSPVPQPGQALHSDTGGSTPSHARTRSQLRSMAVLAGQTADGCGPPPTPTDHGGRDAAVEGAPALGAQHLVEDVRDADVGAGRAYRQPRAHQLQRVDDGLHPAKRGARRQPVSQSHA